jgi:hypothetical protein
MRIEAVSKPADPSDPAEGIRLCRIGWSLSREPRRIASSSFGFGAIALRAVLRALPCKPGTSLPG